MQQKKNNQNQQANQVSWGWVAGITGLACVAANTGLAAVDAHHPPVYDAASTSNRLQTSGGIKAAIPGDSRFWFSSGGVLRLDGAVFMGSSDAKQTDYPNGAHIKTAEWNVRGGDRARSVLRITLKARWWQWAFYRCHAELLRFCTEYFGISGPFKFFF